MRTCVHVLCVCALMLVHAGAGFQGGGAREGVPGMVCQGWGSRDGHPHGDLGWAAQCTHVHGGLCACDCKRIHAGAHWGPRGCANRAKGVSMLGVAQAQGMHFKAQMQRIGAPCPSALRIHLHPLPQRTRRPPPLRLALALRSSTLSAPLPWLLLICQGGGRLFVKLGP